MADTLPTTLTVWQGRYQEIDGIAQDDDDIALGIEDPVLLKFVVKEYYTDADSAALITKTSATATEIRKIDTDAGTYRIFIQGSDTTEMTAGQTYVYEVVYISNPDAATVKGYTMNQGKFVLNATVVDTLTS